MSGLMKELGMEAEDDIRNKIAEALTDYGFTIDDAENLADSCDIPWKLLHDETTDKYTAIIDFGTNSAINFAHDSIVGRTSKDD